MSAITAKLTTRTFHGITLTKGTDFDARTNGAEKIWFDTTGRFEVRADANCERPSELEWGVWDRQADDWADRGNGVYPNTLAACAEVIAATLADEVAERRAQAAAEPEQFEVGAQVTLRSINSLEAPRVVTVIGYTAEGNALFAEGRVEVRITDARNLVV